MKKYITILFISLLSQYGNAYTYSSNEHSIFEPNLKSYLPVLLNNKIDNDKYMSVYVNIWYHQKIDMKDANFYVNARTMLKYVIVNNETLTTEIKDYNFDINTDDCGKDNFYINLIDRENNQITKVYVTKDNSSLFYNAQKNYLCKMYEKK